MRHRITVREALRLVLCEAASVGFESISLSNSLGRTLREEARATEDIPPFDNSGMDGYAVRQADCQHLPALLQITETITAGHLAKTPVVPGTCAAIMTGSPMPDGADTVVPVEWTVRVDPTRVRIERAPSHGTYVRLAGKDVRRGSTVVQTGTVVTPAVLGMLAGAGIHEVMVSCMPRTAVISTGDELYTGAGPLPGGQIRDINGPALSAQVRAAGGIPVGPFYARDNLSSVRQTIQVALEQSDLLLISGGVSVGQHDLVKTVLDGMGLKMLFWRVRQRPGGPLAFGTLEGRAVFGLPGNPVSSSVCFDQYARPFIAAQLGRRQVLRERLSAVLSAQTPKKAGLHFFTRGIYGAGPDGVLTVCDTGGQASNRYTSLAHANCLIHLEEDVVSTQAGDLVSIEPLT